MTSSHKKAKKWYCPIRVVGFQRKFAFDKSWIPVYEGFGM